MIFREVLARRVLFISSMSLLAIGCHANHPKSGSAPPHEPAMAAAPLSVAPVASPVEPAPTAVAPAVATSNPAPATQAARATVAAATAPIESTLASASDPPIEPARAKQDSMEQRLLDRAKDQPRDLAPQFDLQLARLVQNQPIPDGSINSLPPDDRDLLAALCEGLARFRAAARGAGSALLSSRIQPLVDMTDGLRLRAGLTLPAVVLCRTVSQFGVYEPFATAAQPASFPAGRETPVIIYCEVANFASQQSKDRQWETNLSYEMSLFREGSPSMPVLGKKPAAIVDRCRNRRHDFFLADPIKLPPSLAPGKYVLKVTIVDQQAHRIAESTVPLNMVAR
jgi:hypothetical protein